MRRCFSGSHKSAVEQLFIRHVCATGVGGGFYSLVAFLLFVAGMLRNK